MTTVLSLASNRMMMTISVCSLAMISISVPWATVSVISVPIPLSLTAFSPGWCRRCVPVQSLCRKTWLLSSQPVSGQVDPDLPHRWLLLCLPLLGDVVHIVVWRLVLQIRVLLPPWSKNSYHSEIYKNVLNHQNNSF